MSKLELSRKQSGFEAVNYFISKNCKAIKLIQSSVILIFISSIVHAAPVVSTVSKTENSLIITGSNFGTKPIAAPIRFETFPGLNGAKVTDNGWWSTKSGDSNYSPSIKTGVSRAPGRNVADFSMDNNGTLNLFKNGVGFKTTKKAYVNWWAYLDLTKLDGVPVQIKLLNVLRNVAATSDNEYPDQATSLWQSIDLTTSGTLARYYYGSGSAPSLSYKDGAGSNMNIFKTPGWYNFIIQIDQGTLGVADGKTTLWLSGPGFSKYGVSSDLNNVMQINAGDYLDSIKVWQYLQFRTVFSNATDFLNAYAAGYPVGTKVNYLNKGYHCIVATGARGTFLQTPDVDTLHWVKVSDTPITISDTVYIDSLYIDNSFARVEVCDTDTWSTRTHCEIQPATEWLDGSITVNYNPGSFTTGQNVYVYVYDSNGVVNSDGYKFSTGGPAAPKNVIKVPVTN